MTKPEEALERAAHRWRDCEGLAESQLLRVNILRDLVREIHAERSVCLARGDRERAKLLQTQEARIEELGQAGSFPPDLGEALAEGFPIKKRTRLIPDALYTVIDREKLERYDRSWEAALAAEAVTLGWRFWALRAWVRIADVEKFHQALAERIHPHGVVLFAESAPDSEPQGELWQGQWIVALKPHYQTPDFRVRTYPGVAESPSPPAWKLLFSPRPR